MRRAAELSRGEVYYCRAGRGGRGGRTRVFYVGMNNPPREGTRPFVRGVGALRGDAWAVWAGRPRSLSVVLPGRRGPRTAVTGVRGESLRPAAAAGTRRGSGQRDGRGVPCSGASPVLSPSVPAAVGGSGQEGEAAMVNAGAAACATGRDRPRALPLLFNLCCCQHVTPYPCVSHTKITNVRSI